MRILVTALAMGCALLLAGCAGAVPTPSPVPAPVVVQIADSGYGQVVVDADGFALYTDWDSTDPDKLCVDQCAVNWPPLTVTGDFAVAEGLDRSKFSTVTRPDGSKQVKYGNYPLYRFVNDKVPGDNKGHGVLGIWYMVYADGTGVYE